jgi:hypothetical protein
MYSPHALGRVHPQGFIFRTPVLVAAALDWIAALLHCPGRTCARLRPLSFSAAPYDPDASDRAFFAYSDAALLGAPVPGLGGFLHGMYFSFALPSDMLGYAIPQLEFLAIIASAICFGPALTGAASVLVTDSDTCFRVLSNDGAHAPEMQWLHLEFFRTAATAAVFSEVRHGYGETNPCADLASRGRLRELHELCSQLGITPTRISLSPAFASILARFLTTFGPKFAAPPALVYHPRPSSPHLSHRRPTRPRTPPRPRIRLRRGRQRRASSNSTDYPRSPPASRHRRPSD